MSRRRRRSSSRVLPRREELEALVRWYHHLQNEHQRAAPNSSLRRRIEDGLLELHERFDRLLEEWVDDEDTREAWNAHLHNREPAPAEPAAIDPLAFKGRSEAGSIAELRGPVDDLRVEVDGSLVERAVAERDLASRHPTLRLRIDGFEFEESFDSSPEALEALASFQEEGGPPPWEHASELLADGLVDVHFALTPRGARALATP